MGQSALAWLEAFSARHWDFRRGVERNLAVDPEVTPDQLSALSLAAPALGLADVEDPRHDRYDTVILTGGMVRAGIVKPRHVAWLMRQGLQVDRVIFLGAFRPFAGDEAEVAAALGVPGSNEVSAMSAGMRDAFGLEGPTMRESGGDPGDFASWSMERWERGGTRFEVIAAPSPDPKRRRANTRDTYRFWIARERPAPGSRALVVTTPIYVPYQGALAVEVLGLEAGLAVDTVGISAASSDLGDLTQQFRPSHHLQELRSAIGGMRSLRAALSPGDQP